MMFKKILPFIFAAAAAHATPAEAVEPIYVGEPTKKLAQQAARCEGTLTFAEALFGDSHRTAKPELFLDFAIETIGEAATKFLGGQQINFYRNVPSRFINKKLAGDLGVCEDILTVIAKNRDAQRIASCAGTAHAAKYYNLGIGGDSTEMSGDMLAAAAIKLRDDNHVTAIATEKFRSLTQAGPSATQAAIRKCQLIFNAGIEARRAIGYTAPLTGPEIK